MTYGYIVYLFLSSLSIFTSLTIIQHTESKAELTTSLPSVPISKLQGVNLLNPVLIRTSFGPPYYLGNPPPVNTSLHLIKSYGFNFVRIPYYWESYQANPAAFLQEVDFIASLAEKLGLYIDWDFHHLRLVVIFTSTILLLMVDSLTFSCQNIPLMEGRPQRKNSGMNFLIET